MPKLTLLKLAAIFLLFTGCSLNPISTSTNTGLDFKQMGIGYNSIYLARLDTTKLQLQIVQNRDPDRTQNLEEIHKSNKSLFTFNGSFFSEKFTPTGLLISGQQELAPLVKADLLDGIFTIDSQHKPKLYIYPEFKKLSTTLQPEFAIQSGPTLIDSQGNLAVTDKSTKKANRTAIGIDKDGQVVVIIDRESILDIDKSLTLYQFADLIRNSPELKPLGIHSLLNLDGGPSTGFVIGDQYFPEFDKIQNIIITTPLSDQ